MVDYIIRLQEDVKRKYLLALRKRAFLNGSDDIHVKENVNKLEMVLSDLKKLNNETEISDSITESEIKQVMPFEALDQYVYNKEWNKLAPIHKIIKLREYANKLNITNDTTKKELIDKLEECINNKKNNKKLTRSTEVKYDQTKGIIISIPSLKHDNNNKYYLN
jgi:hypothetical protein